MKINQQAIELSKVIVVIQMIVGIAALVFGIVYMTGGLMMAILGMLHLLVGGLFFKWGLKRCQMEPKAYEYEAIIGDIDYIFLAQIAFQTKEDESTVLSNFEWMMVKDYCRAPIGKYKKYKKERRINYEVEKIHH